MNLSTVIDAFFEAEVPPLFGREGQEIPAALARSEYRAFRRHLAATCRPGDLVALSLRHDYRHVIAELACLAAGVPFLPVKPQWPAQRLQQVRDVTRFAHLVTEETYASALARAGTSAPPATFGEDAPAYVLCTSGTTGVPKAVVIPRPALQNFFGWLAEAFADVGPPHPSLLTADFTSDISLASLGLFLLRGTPLHVSAFDGNLFKLALEIGERRISVLSTVPNNLAVLLDEAIYGRASFGSLTHVLVAGSRFTRGTYERMRLRLGTAVRVSNCYGPTEATVYSHAKHMTWRDDGDLVADNVSIGTPLPNVQACIVDGAGHVITEPHRRGELFLAGIQNMTGYLNAPETTARSMTALGGRLWYRTGDLAFADERGEYFVIGRTNETIKRRGHRVDLLDIDGYVQGIEGVQDCMTIAFPHPAYDHVLVLCVVLSATLDVGALRRRLRDLLIDTQMPDVIEVLEELPRNPAGKVSRKALEDRYARYRKEAAG